MHLSYIQPAPSSAPSTHTRKFPDGFARLNSSICTCSRCFLYHNIDVPFNTRKPEICHGVTWGGMECLGQRWKRWKGCKHGGSSEASDWSRALSYKLAESLSAPSFNQGWRGRDGPATNKTPAPNEAESNSSNNKGNRQPCLRNATMYETTSGSSEIGISIRRRSKAHVCSDSSKNKIDKYREYPPKDKLSNLDYHTIDPTTVHSII
jgi:hypothetical protein